MPRKKQVAQNVASLKEIAAALTRIADRIDIVAKGMEARDIAFMEIPLDPHRATGMERLEAYASAAEKTLQKTLEDGGFFRAVSPPVEFVGHVATLDFAGV